MNKNHENFEDRPSLRCRLVRRWEAWRGPASGHTALTERHMETCEFCQAFFAEDFAFEEMLRSDARVEKAAVVPSARFEQRILRAVRESQPGTSREVVLAPKGKMMFLAWSITGAAAGVALALVISQRMAPGKSGPELVSVDPVREQPVAAAGVEAGNGAVETPLRWWKSFDARESALELADKNPLQQEIESISTDAQAVIGFLALNFLPSEKANAGAPPSQG